MQSLQSVLKIQDFRVLVHLGVTAEEQKNTQEVSFDLTLQYPLLPSWCMSDDIRKGICYDAVLKSLMAAATSKPFALIEALCFHVHQVIEKEFTDFERSSFYLTLSVKKLYPPIDQLLGGASFEISRAP